MMSSNRNVKVVKEKRGWRRSLFRRTSGVTTCFTAVVKITYVYGGFVLGVRKKRKKEKKEKL